MTPIYRLTPDLKEVVQQSTMKYPEVFEVNYYQKRKAYQEHLKSLPRFPARGFTEKWLGVDLKEGGNMMFEHWCKKGEAVKICDTILSEFQSSIGLDQCPECYLVAVAVPATEERIDLSEILSDVWEAAIRRHQYVNGDVADWDYKPLDKEQVIKLMIAGASSQKEIERLNKEIILLKDELYQRTYFDGL